MPRRTVPRWAHLAATALAGVLALGLTGCSGDSKPTQAPTLEVTSSVVTTSLAEARDGASAAVLAWRQATVDLYAASDPQLDDLDSLASGNYLKAEKAAIERNLAEGWTSNGGAVALVWARPQESRLEGQDLSLVLYACIDSTAVSGTDGSGGEAVGAREAVDYLVEGTRRDDGSIEWRVADMTLHPGSKAADPC